MTPHKSNKESKHDNKIQKMDFAVDQMTSKEFYIDKNARFHMHETLMRDFVRTGAFQLAFGTNKHLIKDMNVLEVGSGAGLLSLFACKAGAKKIISVEHSKINEIAKEVIWRNNSQNVIEILDKKIEDISHLPIDNEKVDVIVCDWIGYCLLHDSALDSLIKARDRFLKPDGCILPDFACMYVTGLEDFSYVMHSECWWNDVYGFDMSCMIEVSIKEPRIECVDPENVVTQSYMLLDIDVNDVTLPRIYTTRPFILHATKTATIHALVLFFDVCFSKCHTYVGFSTSPRAPYTHYQQTILYLRRPIFVNEGESVNGSISFKQNPKKERGLLLDLHVVFKGVHSNVNDHTHYCITF